MNISNIIPPERNAVPTINLNPLESQERERIPLTIAEIASVQDKLSQERVGEGDQETILLRSSDKIALGSSAAYRIWMQYYGALKTGQPFRYSDIAIDVGDLDFIYSGDNFEEYLEAAKNLTWAVPLESREPKGNLNNLRNFPLTTYYVGYQYVNEAQAVEVEIFNNFTYGKYNRNGDLSDNHPVFTMRVGTSQSIELYDDEGNSINLTDPALLALQSFLYAREGRDDIERAKNLIEIYLSDQNNDLFSLLETARIACPHKSVHFARFIVKWIKETSREEEILAKYFGDKSKDAFEITEQMMDLLDPESFPYHNFFNHIVKVVKTAKKFSDMGFVDQEYAKSVLFALYAHDVGMNLFVGKAGHEERGGDIVGRMDPVAAELIRGSETIYVKGRGLVPSMFIPEKLEERINNLEKLGVSRNKSKELLYFMGLIDISNIITAGQITESFKVLAEDYQDNLRENKTISKDFVATKGELYTGLYKNVRNCSILLLKQGDYEFTEVFTTIFCELNHIDVKEVRLSGLPLVPYIASELAEIAQEKIEIWDYIQERPRLQDSIKRKYLDIVASTKDPAIRDHLNIKFNRYISRIITRAKLKN